MVTIDAGTYTSRIYAHYRLCHQAGRKIDGLTQKLRPTCFRIGKTLLTTDVVVGHALEIRNQPIRNNASLSINPVDLRPPFRPRHVEPNPATRLFRYTVGRLSPSGLKQSSFRPIFSWNRGILGLCMGRSIRKQDHQRTVLIETVIADAIAELLATELAPGLVRARNRLQGRPNLNRPRKVDANIDHKAVKIDNSDCPNQENALDC